MIRKIRNWVITAAFILGGTTVAMAQVKIAHIDSQKLLKEMPDMKKAQAELQKVEQSYTNDIQASIKEYQKKLEGTIVFDDAPIKPIAEPFSTSSSSTFKINLGYSVCTTNKSSGNSELSAIKNFGNFIIL